MSLEGSECDVGQVNRIVYVPCRLCLWISQIDYYSNRKILYIPLVSYLFITFQVYNSYVIRKKGFGEMWDNKKEKRKEKTRMASHANHKSKSRLNPFFFL